MIMKDMNTMSTIGETQLVSEKRKRVIGGKERWFTHLLGKRVDSGATFSSVEMELFNSLQLYEGYREALGVPAW